MTAFFADLIGHWLVAQIPEPFRGFLEVVVLSGMAVVALSLAWSSWRVRQIIRKSLGRNPRLGEDTSLNSWMRGSRESLDTANHELARSVHSRFRYRSPAAVRDVDHMEDASGPSKVPWTAAAFRRRVVAENMDGTTQRVGR